MPPTLTATDKKIIAEIIADAPERYPLTALYAFKGKDAFDLHSKMVSLDEDWLKTFSESNKNKSNMLVLIQTTVSKATLKDSLKKPKTQRQRLLIIFDIPGNNPPVRSGVGYSSPKGKKWLKLLDENKGKSIL